MHKFMRIISLVMMATLLFSLQTGCAEKAERFQGTGSF